MFPLSASLTLLISALRFCSGFFHWSRPRQKKKDWLRDGHTSATVNYSILISV